MAARDRETLDLFTEETYTVSALGRELAGLLREAYPSVWVAGEVQRFRVHGSGHCYFELVEKGQGDSVVGKLDAAIWRADAARIQSGLARHGQRLADGLAIRCRVTLDFYPPHGKLQIHVKEVDPAFALGELEARRRETLAALEAAGLLDANRGVPLPDLPLAIGLVTSAGSAAYHDFVSTLEESGYGFRVWFVHSAVMGKDAEPGVASALELLAAAGVDCIALVRGGGAKSDLAAFDSRAIALAVARSPLPVLTGLGHEIDESVADRVAHRAFKTPTKVAEFLVERLTGADLRAATLRDRCVRAGRLPLARASAALAAAERRVVSARARLTRLGARLAGIARAFATASPRALRDARDRLGRTGLRLGVAAPRTVAVARRERAAAAGRLIVSARGRLAAVAAHLGGVSRLVAELAPERTLRRGFSITRSPAGRALRRPSEVAPGEKLTTELAGGKLASRVEEA